MINPDYQKIVQHYENCLAAHGDSNLGVDWPNRSDADLRYKVMLGLLPSTASQKSLLDFGCGTSHLFEYMSNHGFVNIDYVGLEISEKFFEISRKKFPHNKYLCVDVLQNPSAVPIADYTIMNGVFTEKRQLSFEEMYCYFQSLLKVVFSKTRLGLAFNVMSKAVDWEREDLFHMPTDLLISFLSRDLSRHFVIRNDYGLYEYTVYLYKEPQRD